MSVTALATTAAAILLGIVAWFVRREIEAFATEPDTTLLVIESDDGAGRW